MTKKKKRTSEHDPVYFIIIAVSIGIGLTIAAAGEGKAISFAIGGGIGAGVGLLGAVVYHFIKKARLAKKTIVRSKYRM